MVGTRQLSSILMVVIGGGGAIAGPTLTAAFCTSIGLPSSIGKLTSEIIDERRRRCRWGLSNGAEKRL